MSRALLLDLFVEDLAHAELVEPLLRRLAHEEQIGVSIRVRTSRGGHPRAIDEFELYQSLLEKGLVVQGWPDLLVVCIDANCQTLLRKRAEIRAATRESMASRLVTGCPDPHVERWYLSDPESFSSVVGRRPAIGRKKCDRDHYKGVLSKAVRQAGHPHTLGGIEYARDLVDAMDLYRAGRNDRSLKLFIDEARGSLRRLAALNRGDST